MVHVILIHGLWMTGLESSVLRGRLAHRGFAVEQYHYRSLTVDPDTVVAELAERAAAVPGGVHLVGHSLGGLVALRLAEQRPELPLGHVVLLGSPVNGSGAARGLSRWPGGRWLLGHLPAEELLRERPRAWTRPNPLGVIAGSRPLGVGRVIGDLAEPNDGTVAVDETRLDGLKEHLVLPVSHMGMLLSEEVATAVASFLHHGTFSPPVL
jgi:pimeloyl-ACP methyl ester carboxylesterase